MFSGKVFWTLPVGFGARRRQILEKQICKHDGIIEKNIPNPSVTHIIVSEDCEDDVAVKTVLPSLRNEYEIPKLIRASWLSSSLKSGKLEPEKEHEIVAPRRKKIDSSNSEESAQKSGGSSNCNDRIENREMPRRNSPTKRKHKPDSSEGEEIETGAKIWGEAVTNNTLPSPSWKTQKFACANSSLDATANSNFNSDITERLQILADGYRSTQDKWRAFSYDKAIQAIKKHPKKIESADEVKKVRGIGTKIQDKINEVLNSGELRKADEFERNDKIKTMKLFSNIWGVGPTIAEQWYVMGLRTLEDVRQKAKLSYQQTIGLKFYDEFLQRMPREEAVEIYETVKKAVEEVLDSRVESVVCGSCRRGKATCGDVDILLTHPDPLVSPRALDTLVRHLSQSGFLTDHLVESHQDGYQKKYMGVCCLSKPQSLHRRIDIIAVPPAEYATSLIYFTGSEHFTRSIYALAKSKGMRLNHHGLFGGVMRAHGEKLNDGYHVPTPTEESVFQKLGLVYRPPNERDHG